MQSAPAPEMIDGHKLSDRIKELSDDLEDGNKALKEIREKYTVVNDSLEKLSSLKNDNTGQPINDKTTKYNVVVVAAALPRNYEQLLVKHFNLTDASKLNDKLFSEIKNALADLKVESKNEAQHKLTTLLNQTDDLRRRVNELNQVDSSKLTGEDLKNHKENLADAEGILKEKSALMEEQTRFQFAISTGVNIAPKDQDGMAKLLTATKEWLQNDTRELKKEEFDFYTSLIKDSDAYKTPLINLLKAEAELALFMRSSSLQDTQSQHQLNDAVIEAQHRYKIHFINDHLKKKDAAGKPIDKSADELLNLLDPVLNVLEKEAQDHIKSIKTNIGEIKNALQLTKKAQVDYNKQLLDQFNELKQFSLNQDITLTISAAMDAIRKEKLATYTYQSATALLKTPYPSASGERSFHSLEQTIDALAACIAEAETNPSIRHQSGFKHLDNTIEFYRAGIERILVGLEQGNTTPNLSVEQKKQCQLEISRLETRLLQLEKAAAQHKLFTSDTYRYMSKGEEQIFSYPTVKFSTTVTRGPDETQAEFNTRVKKALDGAFTFTPQNTPNAVLTSGNGGAPTTLSRVTQTDQVSISRITVETGNGKGRQEGSAVTQHSSSGTVHNTKVYYDDNNISALNTEGLRRLAANIVETHIQHSNSTSLNINGPIDKELAKQIAIYSAMRHYRCEFGDTNLVHAVNFSQSDVNTFRKAFEKHPDAYATNYEAARKAVPVLNKQGGVIPDKIKVTHEESQAHAKRVGQTFLDDIPPPPSRRPK